MTALVEEYVDTDVVGLPLLRLREEFLEDPLYSALVNSDAFNRLGGIAFLGVLAYSEKKGINDTRKDHSLGVGLLTYCYCKLRKLPKPVERLLVCSALLHDIHHLPFSHTMEFALKNEIPDFSLLRETKRILHSSRIGKGSISDHLTSFGVDTDALPLFKTRSEREQVFGWTHNVDTLDGIARASRTFFVEEARPSLPIDVMLIISGAKYSEMPYLDFIAVLDEFWHMKDRVYRKGIYEFPKLLFERIFSYYLFQLSVRNRILHRLTDCNDQDLFELFPQLDTDLKELWSFINSLRIMPSKQGDQGEKITVVEKEASENVSFDYEHEVTALMRQFFVDETVSLSVRSKASWDKRYRIRPWKVGICLSTNVVHIIQDVLGESIKRLIPTTVRKY